MALILFRSLTVWYDIPMPYTTEGTSLAKKKEVDVWMVAFFLVPGHSCAGKAINLFWCFVAFIYFFFHTHILLGLKAGRGEKGHSATNGLCLGKWRISGSTTKHFLAGGKNIAAWKNNNTQNKASIAKQNAVSQALCMFQATISRWETRTWARYSRQTLPI